MIPWIESSSTDKTNVQFKIVLITNSGQKWILTLKEPERLLGDGNILYFTLGASYTGITYVKIHKAVHLGALPYVIYI